MQLHTNTFLQGGKYKIEKVLGQGGFGITYLGTQVALNRKVAIKEFFMKEYCNRNKTTSHVSVPSEGSKELVAKFKAKFIKEAQIIAKLNHPHIIRIHDIFEENGTAYYVMEYWNNGSLAEYVKSRGRLNENEALHYIRQIADALGYIHNHNMNHLDVKPGNILLDENKDAVLIDFGLSKQYDQEGNQTSTTPVGISHGYAPLEQYKKGGVGTFSPTTDIYSLGATLYKLLTGQTPPDANDVMDEGLPALPSFVSSSTALAIKKAMQTSRKDRPQSVKEFLALLDDEVTIFEPKVEPKKTPKATVTPTSNPFKKWIIPLAACVVVALAIILWPKDKAIENTEIVARQIPIIKVDSIDHMFVEQKTSASIEDERIQKEEQRKNDSIAKEKTRLKSEKEKQKKLEESISTYQKVDLGLSVYWAGYNLGTNKPEEIGDLYAWGEINSKNIFSLNTYKYYKGSQNGYINIGNNISRTQYDAAHILWGNGWRLPTKEEIEELITKCTITEVIYKKGKKVIYDGKEIIVPNGIKVTGPNGNSIFISYNNHNYWTGTKKSDWSNSNDGWSWSYVFDPSDFNLGIMAIHEGRSIRPVCSK